MRSANAWLCLHPTAPRDSTTTPQFHQQVLFILRLSPFVLAGKSVSCIRCDEPSCSFLLGWPRLNATPRERLTRLMHWTAGFRPCSMSRVTGPPPVMSVVRPLDSLCPNLAVHAV